MRIKGFGNGGGLRSVRGFVGLGGDPTRADAGAFHEGFEHDG